MRRDTERLANEALRQILFLLQKNSLTVQKLQTEFENGTRHGPEILQLCGKKDYN